jgi:deoxyadenosine/deoxycytidine kinase
MDQPSYIVVEGPIGVGKTSLAEMLAQTFQGRAIYERPDKNPFLEGFYQNKRQYAFQAQVFFLLSRFQQQRELRQHDLFEQTTVCDYLFAKDRIFAHLNLDENELNLYEKIFELLDTRLTKPDLIIYLKASSEILLERIKKRGVTYERNITADYLKTLVKLYNQFFFHYENSPLLVVETSEIDFVKNPEDFGQLVKAIKNIKGGVTHFKPLGSH